MESKDIFIWPVINGQEREVTYTINLVDEWGDSDLEQAGREWEYALGSEFFDDSEEVVKLWIPDGYLEAICEKDFAKKF